MRTVSTILLVFLGIPGLRAQAEFPSARIQPKMALVMKMRRSWAPDRERLLIRSCRSHGFSSKATRATRRSTRHLLILWNRGAKP